MNNLNRMIEINKLIQDKIILLKNTNKTTDLILYNQLESEITGLKNELTDFVQIDIADTSKSVEQKDKNIQIVLDQMDFDTMESDDFRLLAKIDNVISSLTDVVDKEIKDILDSAKPKDSSSSEDEIAGF